METELLSVEIYFRTKWDISDLMGVINLGAITLEKEGREYILDPSTTQFEHSNDGGTTATITLDDLETVRRDFPDCKFDLTDTDFGTRNFNKAEMFITFEDDAKHDYASDISGITLAYKQHGCTMCVDLDSEMFELID